MVDIDILKTLNPMIDKANEIEAAKKNGDKYLNATLGKIKLEELVLEPYYIKADEVVRGILKNELYDYLLMEEILRTYDGTR